MSYFKSRKRVKRVHFKCIWMTQSTFANWSLSLFIHAELSPKATLARGMISQTVHLPTDTPQDKRGDSGAKWQLHALNAFLSRSSSASKY